jgi:CDP-diacylglycerol--glycerol-3-phosphate 3-phosphatidyltransferase
MKNKIPAALIWFRLLAGLLILLLAFTDANRGWIVLLMTTGLLSDIFYGIIARRLNISTQTLRRLDSSVDQVFWLWIVVATYVLAPGFYKENWVSIVILLSAEALCYAVCYLRFRKEVATHAIASKIWTLILFATLVDIVLNSTSNFWFQLCFYTGLLTRLEVLSILLLIREWTNDIPSVYHAILLRNGKPIKRNKMFNG